MRYVLVFYMVSTPYIVKICDHGLDRPFVRKPVRAKLMTSTKDFASPVQNQPFSQYGRRKLDGALGINVLD